MISSVSSKPLRHATPPLDLSTVDSPQKAALMPALGIASFQMFNEMLEIRSADGPYMASQFDLDAGGSALSVAYTMDGDSHTPVINGQGTVGSAPFAERWTFDTAKKVLDVHGTIGGSTEALRLTWAGDGMHVDGTIGTMDVHEVVTQHGENDDAHVVADGTIGGQKFHQDATSHTNADESVVMHITGSLNNVPILQDVRFVPGDTDVSAEGHGNLAGVPISWTQNVNPFG